MLRAVAPLPAESPLLTPDDVAARTGINVGIVRSLLRSGAIPSVTSGDERPHYYVHRAELEDWIVRGRPRVAAQVVTASELLFGLQKMLEQHECEVTVRFHRRP